MRMFWHFLNLLVRLRINGRIAEFEKLYRSVQNSQTCAHTHSNGIRNCPASVQQLFIQLRKYYLFIQLFIFMLKYTQTPSRRPLPLHIVDRLCCSSASSFCVDVDERIQEVTMQNDDAEESDGGCH